MEGLIKALVVGDIIEDIVVMPIGQVQSNTDNESKLVATSGGSAANFAVWLATLQIETHLFARVGKGDGKKFAAEFKLKCHCTFAGGSIPLYRPDSSANRWR